MKALVPVGRVAFALIFLGAAPRHFSAEGIAHAAGSGFPLAGLMVPLSGLLAIVSALFVAAGFKTRWGAWGLVLFLLPITFTLHAFWTVAEPVWHHVQQAMFAKNLSMIGAALMLTHFGGGPFSVDEALARRSEGRAG